MFEGPWKFLPNEHETQCRAHCSKYKRILEAAVTEIGYLMSDVMLVVVHV